ncbi:MAG: photosystem II protein PsbQ [Stigonema ocellatum SAG 48.90 = DSM 106950]|nr:photosystem II protein PsbQ [Stigonema ocellatum SAG 48.90 = DSM 106950]
MARQRSVLSFILVILATFLISCGSPSVATAPPTYTPDQLEKIQEYVTDIVAVRDRSLELQQLIQNKQWINVGNFIHGPMAEARLNMTYITSNLLPKEQETARKLGRDLFEHLVKIDQAAQAGKSEIAVSNYQAAYTDINKFLQLLPPNQE